MNNDVFIVQLDRPRELKFNHTALKTLVSMTGRGLEDLEQDITADNFEIVEDLAYCALLKDARQHGETLTPERVVELMDEAPVYTDLLKSLFTAWNAAFGAQKQDAEGNGQAPAEQPAKGNHSTGKKVSG